MQLHRGKHQLLAGAVGAACLASCGGISLNPSHVAKFTFEGRVTRPDGAPIANAWVRVRGWETLTDTDGRWKEEQVIDCGASRAHMDSFEENDSVLVQAEGFESAEEKFVVKHPALFAGCDQAERTVAFETTLKPESAEKRLNRQSAQYKPREYHEVPWPMPKKKNQ